MSRQFELTSGSSARLFPLCFDDDGDALTYSLVSSPAHGTVGGPSVDDEGRTYFSYTSDAGYLGTDGFSFVASDGDLTSGVATYDITLIENVRPDCSARHDYYDARRGGTARAVITCADDGPLTYQFPEPPAHGTVTPSNRSDGSTVLLYTNDGTDATTDWFTVVATDGTLTSNAVRYRIDIHGDVIAVSIPGPQPASVWVDDRDEAHVCSDLDAYRVVDDPTGEEFFPSSANHLAVGLEPTARYGYDCEIDWMGPLYL